MKKQDKPTVLLLYGGRGCERAVSVEGSKYAFPLIDREKYTVIPTYIRADGQWLIPDDTEPSRGCADMGIIEALAQGIADSISVAPAYIDGRGGLISTEKFIAADCALPLLHGDFGEDGIVQGALENARLPYVGCGVRTGALLCDKGYTKLIAEYLRIPVADWIYSKSAEGEMSAKRRAEARLSYPMFIKPACLGSSVGAARVCGEQEFCEAYRRAAALGESVLIEECVDVEKELECAYFSAKGKEIFTELGEIRYDGGFYDYDSKYGSDSCATVSSASCVTEEMRKKVREIAGILCRFFGVRHLCRIDFFLSRDGRLLFNEINTFPGFTEGSLYPRLLQRSGVCPEELLNLLIEAALEGD